MEDILVATGARPQNIDSDERLGERQQQCQFGSNSGVDGLRKFSLEAGSGRESEAVTQVAKTQLLLSTGNL